MCPWPRVSHCSRRFANGKQRKNSHPMKRGASARRRPFCFSISAFLRRAVLHEQAVEFRLPGLAAVLRCHRDLAHPVTLLGPGDLVLDLSAVLAVGGGGHG